MLFSGCPERIAHLKVINVQNETISVLLYWEKKCLRSITKCLVLWIIFCISFTVPFLEKSYYLRLAPMIAILGHTGIYSPLFLSSMLFWFNNWNFFLHELSSLVWSSERPVCPQSCTYCTYYLCDSNIFHQIWDNSWIQITIVAFQGGLNHIS